MKAGKMSLVALLIFGISLVPLHSAMAAKRLGLHVTQEELDIWRQRAAKGPYKTTGDVSTNSPGDWTRMLNNANAFLSNPSAERWKGQVEATCKTMNSEAPKRNLGEKLRDAGFVYLITGDTKYRDAARNELLAQAAETGTNFADRTRWCPTVLTGTHQPVLDINMWLNKMLFGYDYIRSSLTHAHRDTLDRWFLNAGLFFETQPTLHALKRWPNRDKDDYSSSPYGLSANGILYFGGPTWYWWNDVWANQASAGVRFSGLVGLMLDNAYLKTQAKRWVREFLRFGVWPDGTVGDMYRHSFAFQQRSPCQGWWYSGATLGAAITLADHFARQGDTSLYDYITSEGYAPAGTAGGPKSLKRSLIRYYQYMDHMIVRYGTIDKGNVGNPDYTIDNVCGNTHGIQDVWQAQANIYFNDPYIRQIYMRTAPNVPHYPTSPATGGFNAWGGDQGIYPGVLFMFGQMEGKAWPYLLPGGDSEPPQPPKGLRIQ